MTAKTHTLEVSRPNDQRGFPMMDREVKILYMPWRNCAFQVQSYIDGDEAYAAPVFMFLFEAIEERTRQIERLKEVAVCR